MPPYILIYSTFLVLSEDIPQIFGIDAKQIPEQFDVAVFYLIVAETVSVKYIGGRFYNTAWVAKGRAAHPHGAQRG